MTADPTIVKITTEDAGLDDPWWIEETLQREARKLAKDLPPHYTEAVVTDPGVRDWVKGLLAIAKADRGRPYVRTGPSLLLVGSTGTGKTFEAYGAIRALANSGAGTSWLVTTAADMYAKLRPRPNVDMEAQFERFAQVSLLVLDDLGAAKGSEWNEEINYRLINHRYEQHLPTLITSNIPPKQLASALGERVASRLAEMTTLVVLKGADRRRKPGPAA